MDTRTIRAADRAVYAYRVYAHGPSQTADRRHAHLCEDCAAARNRRNGLSCPVAFRSDVKSPQECEDCGLSYDPDDAQIILAAVGQDDWTVDARDEFQANRISRITEGRPLVGQLDIDVF